MKEPNQMHVSAKSIEITPPVGTALAGGPFGPATGVKTPLVAASLYLANASAGVLLISCDVIGFDGDYAQSIGRRINAATGIHEDAILLCATHTHNGPSTATYRNWSRPDEDYRNQLADLLVELAESTVADAVPGRVGSAWAPVHGVGRNRVAGADGVVDERVRVLRAETLDGQVVAAVIGHGCHPVNMHSSGRIDGDYPARLREAFAERVGLGGSVPQLFLMAGAGDVLPANFHEAPDAEAAEATGRLLAEAAASAWADVEPAGDAVLAYATRSPSVGLEPLPDASELEEFLDKHQRAATEIGATGDIWEHAKHRTRTEWARAALDVVSRGIQQSHQSLRLQGVRIGEMVMVGIPGELFVEFDAQLWERSDAALPWVVTQVNGTVGYLASRRAYELESYEATKCYRYIGVQNFAPGVGELIADESAALIGDLMRAEANAASRALWDRGCRTVVGGGQAHKRPVKYMYRGGPAFAVRGEGCRFYDVDGRPYIDYLLGYGPILLGYGHPAVAEAVERQMREGTIFSVEHPRSIEVAERLCELIPCADVVAWFIGGSSATAGALRAARAHTGREKIIRCGYHGWLDWAFSDQPGVPAVERELILATQYNDADALGELLDAHRGEVAGVIIESVQEQGPDDGYFHAVRRLCDEHGAVFILDEVKSGFRFDMGGAQRLYGIEPDMATFGKAMCNGYPGSALVGRRAVLGPRADTFMAATFHGDPVSLAAADAVMDVMQAEDGIARLHRAGRRLMAGINRVFTDTAMPLEVVGHPAMPMLRETDKPRDPELTPRYPMQAASAFCAAMQRQGVYVTGHVWFLSLAHDDAAIDESIDAAAVACAAVRDELVGIGRAQRSII